MNDKIADSQFWELFQSKCKDGVIDIDSVEDRFFTISILSFILRKAKLFPMPDRSHIPDRQSSSPHKAIQLSILSAKLKEVSQNKVFFSTLSSFQVQFSETALKIVEIEEENRV